ncbi:MAG: GNAT family N-acetyltransferase [Ornithinimicrobium sp.]
MVIERAAYELRPPVAADAEALGRLHCQVWRDTYADVMDPAAYAALSPKRFTAGWRRRLEGASDEGLMAGGDTVRIAEHRRDGIVGFISVGPARDENPPTPWQLWALNIVAAHQGTGLAQHLMSEGLGDGPAYLHVARGNDRAIAFYLRHGFALDGTEVVDGHDGITEVRMVRHG